MNQADLGNKIGVSFQQIQKYEKGNNKISAERLYELAEVLSTNLDYFYYGVGLSTSNKNEIASNLNEEPKEFLYSYSEDGNNRETIALVKLYNNIDNRSTRKKLLLFLKTLSKDSF